MTTPSLPMFFAMCAGAAAMIGIVLWFFSYATLAGPYGDYLPRSKRDNEAMATQRALSLALAPPERPRAIVTGSSATGNSLAREDLVAAAIDEATGGDWLVGLLATPLQSPLDQIALVERALGPPPGPQAPVYLIVGHSALRDGWSAERMLSAENRRRIGLRSDWEDEEVRRLGGAPLPRSDWYIVENFHFFVVNGAKSIVRLLGHLPAARRYEVNSPAAYLPVDRRKRDIIVENYRRGRETAAPESRAILARLAERLRAYPSVRLVLIDEGLNPELLDDEGLRAEDDAWLESMAAFARSIGAAFWPIHREASISSGSYYDDLHVSLPAARDKIRERLARHIAEDVKGAR